jgi:hypothetical protein
MQNFNSQSLIGRMIGAVRLDVATYEEVEKEQSATTQAIIVVVAAAIAAGIGSLNSDGGMGFIVGIIGGVLGWAVYSISAYFIGARLFPTQGTQADTGQLLRTLGFANTPRLLFILGFIPVLGAAATLVGFVWWIIASIVALKQSLEMNTGRAIITGLLALIPFVLIMGIFFWIFGVSPPGDS